MDKLEHGKDLSKREYSLSGEHRWIDKSQYRKNLSKQGATHFLESIDGWTSQDR
jgi:hypothetical protein